MSDYPTICAFWNGKCRALTSPETSNLGEQLAEWVRDGATIKTLPMSEARAAFMRGMEDDE